MRTLAAISAEDKAPLRLSKRRDNVKRLGEHGNGRTREQAELERLQEYLRMWAHVERSETELLQVPRGVPYLDSVKGTIDSYATEKDYDRRLDKWARTILDAAIDDLLDLHDGWMMRGDRKSTRLNSSHLVI